MKDRPEDVILRSVIDALLFYVVYIVFGPVSHYQKADPHVNTDSATKVKVRVPLS